MATQLLVSVARFRNACLAQRGMYRVRLGVLVLTATAPSPSSSSSETTDESAKRETQLVSWTRQRDPTNAFRGRQIEGSLTEPPALGTTSAFEIRYENEDVEFSPPEQALFLVSSSATWQPDARFVLECSLEFAPLEETPAASHDQRIPAKRTRKADYATVQTSRVDISSRYALRDFCVVVFGDMAKSGGALLELTLHSATLSLPRDDAGLLGFGPEWETLGADALAAPGALAAAERRWNHVCARAEYSLHLLKTVARELDVPSAPAVEDDVPLVTTPTTPREWNDARTAAAVRTVSLASLLWTHIVQTLKNEDAFSIELERLRVEWTSRATDVAGELVLREALPTQALADPVNVAARRAEIKHVASRLRAAPRFSETNAETPLTDGKLFLDFDARPIVCVREFSSTPSRPGANAPPPPTMTTLPTDIHLVVAVHGFLGSHYDFRAFQLALLTMDLPHVRFLASMANEENTEIDIATQAKNLLSELRMFVKDKNLTVDRISFVGYSMGAIVARAAVARPEFAEFRPKLWAFVSVAGPHLGTLGGDSSLVGMGTWALMKWRGSVALSQLSLSDATGENGEPLLRTLARHEEKVGLGLFPRVVLITSRDDTYVPSFSASVELPLASANASATAATPTTKATPNSIQTDIQRDLTRALARARHVSKIELAFEFASARPLRARIDAVLGRTAHVHVLDSVALNFLLLLCFGREWFPDQGGGVRVVDSTDV